MADMWTLINRELAKIEQARGGVSATPQLDILKETMQYAKEDRVWKERKNEQMRSIIDMRTQGYGTEYNNPTLDKDIASYENWFKSNQGKFNDMTMEYAQITLDNMKNQRKDNEDFDMYESQIAERREQMLGTLEAIDITGEKLTKENIDLIRTSNQDWISYTGEFTKRFGDRLSMKGFEHIKNQLSQGATMNTFLLESAKDDGWIDEKEYEAYKDSWEDLNTIPIAAYLKREDEHDDTVSKGLVSRLDAKIDLYSKLDAFIGDPSTGRKPHGTLPIGISGLDPEGGQEMSWNMMKQYFGEDTGEIQKMLIDQRKNEKEIMTEWDDQYKKLNIGKSMITPRVKDFYGVPEEKKKPDDKDDVITTSPADVTELTTAVDKLNIEKERVSKIASSLNLASDSLNSVRKFLGLRGQALPQARKLHKKTVEIDDELLAKVETNINNMAAKGKGGLKKAERMQKLWNNYLSALEEFKGNKTAKEIQSEINVLRKEFGLSKG